MLLPKLLLVLLGMMVVASCTTTSNGEPSPVPASDATSSGSTPPSSNTSEPGGGELPYAGAPGVENPLDTTRFQQDPCQSLTAAQAQELNVNSPGEPYEGALGNACNFRGKSDRRARVDVRFQDKFPYGLSAEYQAHEDGKHDFFLVLDPIEEYPAVARAGTDDRPNGGCTVVIGASDEITFEVALLLSQANVGTKDPCETAAMVAGMALQTMKAGQ